MHKLHIHKLKYALFDWDNTLAESKPALLVSIKQVLQEKKLPNWEELEKIRDNNISFKANFKNFFGNRADEIYSRYAEIYLQNIGKMIKTYPKVHEVFELMEKHNIKKFIMSNKDRQLLEYELPLLFSPQRFEKIICGCEAPLDKPHPEQIIYALCGYLSPQEITRENVWVIGDSPQDSTAALAAGALPIRIGKSIWKEYENYSDKIIYFKNFNDFYQTLSLQN